MIYFFFQMKVYKDELYFSHTIERTIERFETSSILLKIASSSPIEKNISRTTCFHPVPLIN